MAPTPSSILYALCLLLLKVADGRILLQQTTHVYEDSVAPAANTSSFLDATSSTTTNSYDVAGLMRLMDEFPHLSGVQFPAYTKDPCYPQILSWISCSNDPIRRVTALYLSYENLYGYLPDFGEMDALLRIEFQGNYLRGSIPEFLGYLPELTYLNLAYNDFTGRIPDSLANNRRITLYVAGNYRLCNSSSYSCSPTSYSPPSRFGTTDFDLPKPKPKPKIKSRKLLRKVLIPATVLILVGFICVIGAICACCCPEKKPPPPPPLSDTTTATAAAQT